MAIARSTNSGPACENASCRQIDESRIRHLNQTLLALRSINRLITRDNKDAQGLLDGVCHVLVETQGLMQAWIALIDADGKPFFASQAGMGQELDQLVEKITDGRLPACARRAILLGRAVIVDVGSEFCGHCAVYERHGQHSAMVAPLKYGEKLWGILNTALSDKSVVSDEELGLFGEMAEDIAFALNNIEMEAGKRDAEAALQVSEKRLRNLVETTSDLVWEIDENLKYTYVSPHMRNLLGYEPSELIGKTPYDLMGPVEAARVAKVVDPIIKRRKPINLLINVNRHRDGRSVILETNAVPVFDSDGVFRGYHGMDRDVTEREKVESALELTQFSVERAADGIYWVEPSGKFMAVNEAACRILGYTSEELRSMSVWDISPGMTKEQWSKNWPKIKGLGTSIIEARHRTKNGDVFPVEISRNYLKHGDKEYTCSFARDITERKKAEEIIKRRLRVEETISRVSARFVGIVSLDDAINASLADIGQLCEADRAYLFRFSDDEKAVDNTHEWCDGGVSPQKANLQNLPIEAFPWWVGQLGRNETVHIQDVSAMPAEAAAEKSILESQGIKAVLVLPINIGNELSGFIGLDNIAVATAWPDEDISILRMAANIIASALEKAGIEEELRLRAALLDAAMDSTFLYSPEGELVYVNEVAHTARGYTLTEMMQMHVEELRTSYEASLLPAQIEAILDGRLTMFETVHVRKDGTTMPVEVRCQTVDHAGRALIMAITRDITERIKMQERLVVADRLSSIGEMAAGIAHEINNPLTGVIGFSELLLERSLPSDIKADMEVIHHEAMRTSTIVKNMLAFARQHKAIKKPVAIHEVIDDVLRLRSHEHEMNNIRVNTCYETLLPDIEGDPFQLQQVFLNLVINAEYFMKQAHGGGTLTITTTESNGENILIKISDDGPGISPENLGRLFNPFFTTKEVGKGTGLGLSICHGIVNAHGGDIRAESGYGKGATFIIELPVGCKREMNTDD
ncbi:PAS domain S-box-containing protein [Dehalogenimonas formicexedens]|uniref:histidine kinase n=1 Tax=Dehalogenimonas formicexedens TaxID=1839801 RepID=A0A1P8F9K1_9CHLR|nr:PAS domain S-box protein [Dehalogenimonas formicexedens]APV45123.1 PAS domain S-box-containing protein [Dehalogenimonas formicexedens]